LCSSCYARYLSGYLRSFLKKPFSLFPLCQISVNPYLWELGFIVFVFYTSVWSIMSTMLVYGTKHLGFTTAHLGVLLLIYGVVSMFSEGVLVKLLVPRLGEFPSMRLAILCFMLQCIVTALASSAGAVYASVLLCLGSNLFYPAASAWVSRSVGEAQQGEVLGAMNGIKALVRCRLSMCVSACLFVWEHVYGCTKSLCMFCKLYLCHYMFLYVLCTTITST
jgi:predicted MFS family arabinose efflux permease